MSSVGAGQDDLSKIKSLTKLILDASVPAYALFPEIKALSEIFSHLAVYQKQQDIAVEETATERGLAVSPTMAAMCVEDYARTIVFMRGLYAAIESVQTTSRPVQVLYIGCGPYATLALPIMCVLSSQRVQFTLLDIHQQSIRSVQSVTEQLGVTDRIRSMETVDAGDYQVDSDLPPDIVLMEIMQVCLMKEPQVAISRHIMAQVPDALLLPHKIQIDLIAIDAKKELLLQTDTEGNTNYDRQRQPIGMVFELSSQSIHDWSFSEQKILPASGLQIPKDLTEGYEVLLFTHIQVFAEHVLGEYDSGLSCPQGLPTTAQVRPGDQLQFSYRLGNDPGLRVEIL
ncbi:hypothetical protein [Marinicella sp. W31]|uniref:hypothetical protein n=1 Tax=Marinicella sp. W31 TaxID=3023713 RepID=UPI0037564D3F